MPLKSIVPASDVQPLILACLAGDRNAQRKLYEAYSSLVFGLIRRYINDEAEAEDVLSAVFVRIFKRLDQYRFEGSFNGWVRSLTVRIVLDQFRKKKPFTEAIKETNDTIIDTDQVDGQSLLSYKELIGFIRHLPDTQRAVFNMFAIEGYTHREISTLLEISEINSRWYLNNARKRLKQMIMVCNR